MTAAGDTVERVAAAERVTDLVGETPLLWLDSFASNLYGKLESSNPYSVKDRIALAMVEAARECGALSADGTVVEATSGNTGIGLAAVCAANGYDCVLTMPASMSEERRRLLRALGADLELTPAEDGMGGAIERADELAEADDAVRARQFENEANPSAHRETTGPEIWDATDGSVDAVVAGVGTGGTITGVSEHLKEDRGKTSVTSVAVEPDSSRLLSADDPDSHDIQGIGPGFVPDVLRRDLLDEVRTITSDDAREWSRRLGHEEGVLVGISAGAALGVAVEYAREHPDETVVVVLPDTGERYLSTDLFE
ncbi:MULTISPECIES: cysteine synthase A [Halomicrobium]|uniref:Cysteine synthase A n=2 Tax=Halomicrobium mukohataei TaxID=57705 RepID=C7P2Y6_HALMD|nr:MULTISPECIES: cysteine synthase A [Halomicrobium]ACV47458.1 cysteine synthase A [Halomicrobium mukohataei DSM 12286]QCD65922.1 cysteine synthase A [Halomicrobium mukohataei]QFR20727.1 cysteine synthase A [Halomicrobium sp. ZPS1]